MTDAAAESRPLVSIRGLRKQFAGKQVLDGVDLDLPRGQTTVVLGPSGCGKSVTLKHIVGLLKPDEGEVHFDGERIDYLTETKLIPYRLRMGLLFQMSALFDSMNVLENIEFPMREHTDLGPEQRLEKVKEVLRIVDMQGVEKQLPAELSGGQRKRIALARAVVLGPDLMLYDEPTTGLDPIRADGIDQLVLRLKKELGMTSLVVTHDLTSGRKVADRVIMMLDGKVAATGSWDEIEASEDARVQRFLAGKYDHDDE